jgi:RHS repeat-associated protein
LKSEQLNEENRSTTYTTDLEGRRLSATTGTNVLSYQYFGNGLLQASKVSGPGGTTLNTSYTYDEWGRKKTLTDPNGKVSTFAYDLADRLQTATSPAFDAWDAAGVVMTANSQAVVGAGYDTFGSQTHVKDPRALITVSAFDGYGRTSQVTYPTNATVTPTERFVYDTADNMVSTTDRRGFVTTNVFDAFGRKRQVTQPIPATGVAAPVTKMDYNDVSEMTLITDPNLNKTQNTYDGAGRVRTTTTAFGSSTTTPSTSEFDYDDLGNRIFTKDGFGNITRATFNAASQPKTVTDPTSAITNYTYIAQTGWTDTVTVANARRAQNFYDPAGRLIEQQHQSVGGVVQDSTKFGYDPASNRTSVTRPNTVTDTYTYDSLNRLTSSITDISKWATGSPVVTATSKAGFDIGGNMVRVEDANTNVTTVAYNNWGLPSAVTEPSTAAFPNLADRQWTVAYNAAGMPTVEVRPGAITVTKTYDNLNRLTGETGVGTGAVSASRSIGYDAAGRIKTVGGQTLAYDDRNNLLTSTGVQGNSTFAYDTANRITTRTDAAGTSTFGWTTRSQLASITTNATTTSYGWLGSGELDTISYPGGTGRKYLYDDMGRVTTDTVKNSVAAEISKRAYTYRDDSSVSSMTVTQAGNTAAGLYTYTYDKGARLETVTNPANAVTTYAYDPAGNRLKDGISNYTYDARNRIVTGPGTAYNWTARGTLSSTNQSGAGITNYTFDGLDRMTAAGAVTYAYDSLDRVTTRTTGGVATAFSYAGVEKDPVAEGTTTKYLRGPDGQSIHGIIRGGTLTFAGADRHGDVSFTLSTTGAIVDSKVRDPNGKTLGSTGTATNIGFQSDWTDPTNGLVWMGARWYNPQTATFTSRDTYPGQIGAYATLNKYTYGLNNPLRYTDPTGHYNTEGGSGGGGFDTTTPVSGSVSDGWVDDSYNGRFQRGELKPKVEVYETDMGPSFIVSTDQEIVVSSPFGTARELVSPPTTATFAGSEVLALTGPQTVVAQAAPADPNCPTCESLDTVRTTKGPSIATKERLRQLGLQGQTNQVLEYDTSGIVITWPVTGNQQTVTNYGVTLPAGVIVTFPDGTKFRVPEGGVSFVRKGTGVEVLAHEMIHLNNWEETILDTPAGFGVGIDIDKSTYGNDVNTLVPKRNVLFSGIRGEKTIRQGELLADCMTIDLLASKKIDYDKKQLFYLKKAAADLNQLRKKTKDVLIVSNGQWSDDGNDATDDLSPLIISDYGSTAPIGYQDVCKTIR